MQYDYMIYPKQFRAAKIPTEKNYCFFLMPFHERFDLVYGAVKEQLMNCGFVCNRADELSGSKPIINKILTEILRAQYIVVDLTDCNPNVFYELGIAHTFKDAQNVLLIKQKDSKVPFDITHLQYQEYSAANLKQLTSMIKEFISNNQCISEFYEALNVRGIIGVIHDNHEDFLDYLRLRLGEDITTITTILNYHGGDLNEAAIEDTLDRYQLLIHRVFDSNRKELLSGVLRLYEELLISCSSYMVAETHVSFFLNGFFAQHKLSVSEAQSYQTDLAVALAQKKKLLPIVLPWIINYFTRSKAAVIDLNRYKLEAFLMTSDYEEVNRSITNALFAQDCHIREHLADIIGEKRLVSAKDALCRQLAAEENFYTAVSIMEAIGKIGDTGGITHIEQWICAHKQDIVTSKMYFVFRHAYNAMIKLDSTPEGTYRERFIRNYGQYVTDNVPL
ncbi:hypothetical protein CE91St44_03910 [Oscillospiraceae bacterium]|nr:hypothetical protein CE91St44_03910 [Oscillospiraceae bacterium]